MIATNMTKYKDILLHLKRNSIEPPDIDVFKLRIIFDNLLKRLQKQVNRVRDICKHNDLDKALKMHQDLVVFVYQIRELEERSSVTGMFSTYLRYNRYDDDLKLYQGLSNQRQYYLLRKQFDDRMRKLANLSLIQRVRIQKYEHYIEDQMGRKEAQQTLMSQDFESQFNNLFQQKIEEIKSQQFLKEFEHKKRHSCFTNEKNLELIKSRDSIQMSASVQDINEMIDSLNQKYSQRINSQENNFSRISQGVVENIEAAAEKTMKMSGAPSNILNQSSKVSGSITQNHKRPSLNLNHIDKLDRQRKSQQINQIRVDD